jgi:hypothetical protein
MATVEVLKSGSKILRHPPGGQPLLTAGVTRAEFIWLSTLDQVLLLRRHWDAASESTVACLCEPRCGSSRVDRVVATLLRVDHALWEERLLLLPEEGWRSFERAWLLLNLQRPCPMGARCTIQRTGSRRNGRTCCVPLDWIDDPPSTFDVTAAARQQLHVSADFFGRGAHGLGEEPGLPPVAIPGVTGKPRVPKGRHNPSSHG